MNSQPDKSHDDDLRPARPVAYQGGIAGYGRKVFSSFRNPMYRQYYYSLTGHWAPMQMQMQARTLLIYRITGSGQLLGTMALAHSIPMLILSLWGGALADRLDKKKILFYGQAASGILALGVALAITFGYLGAAVPGSWWILMVSSLVQGIIMGLMMPSRASMVPEIVDPEDLMNAISLNNMGMNVFRIIAPAATGFIIEGLEFATAYYVMAALYMSSNFFLMRVRIRKTGRPKVTHQRSTTTEVVEGLRYIRGNSTIMLILVFTLACTILGMPFTMLLPMFTEDILNVGADGMGIILAVSGIGAIAVSLVMASMPNKKRGLMMILSGVVLALALAAFSFNTSMALALVWSVFIGLGQTGQTAFGFTLVQYYVDPTFRGRVMSFMMVGFGMAGLGAFFGGILADSISIVWSIGGLALALAVLCVWVFLFTPRLRNLD